MCPVRGSLVPVHSARGGFHVLAGRPRTVPVPPGQPPLAPLCGNRTAVRPPLPGRARRRSEPQGLVPRFAWSRARLGISSQPRRDGDFEYYETLSEWISSGGWDTDPARAGLQPESDPATYNGRVWGLAREIFNVGAPDPEGSPGYARALDYYRERGYGPAFLWEWRGGADQGAFRAMITESDRRAADARRALWILTANHLFSAIDGFITARLAAMPPNGQLGLVARLPLP